MGVLIQPIPAVVVAGGTPVAVSGTVTAEGGLTDEELRADPIEVVGPSISSAAVISGQITVATAGTAVQGSNVALTNGVFVKALGGNTGKVYVGNDGAGDVTSSNGFELAAGEVIPIQVEDNLQGQSIIGWYITISIPIPDPVVEPIPDPIIETELFAVSRISEPVAGGSWMKTAWGKISAVVKRQK